MSDSCSFPGSFWRYFALGIFGIYLAVNSIAQNPVYKSYGVDDGLPTNDIYQIMQDTKGYIWLGTSKGAVRFDGNRFENFTMEDGLPDNEILKIIQDKQERIWFISFTGPLSYYDGIIHNSSNTPWLKKLEFTQSVNIFTPLSDGSILMFTNRSRVLRLRDTAVEVFDTLPYTNIIEEKDSSILKIRSDFFMENGKRIKLPEFNLAANNVFMTYHDRLQDILMIGVNSDLYSYHHHELKRVNNSFLLSDSKKRNLTSDNEGYFWFTDFNNLYRFKVDADSRITSVQKYFEGISINYVFEDKDANFWFSTKGDGLLMVPSLQIKLFNKASGLADNNVTAALKMNDNNILCGTLTGYLNAVKNEQQIGSTENLHDGVIRKIINYKNNTALILCNDNISQYDHQSIKRFPFLNTAFKTINLNSKGEIVVGGYHEISKLKNGKWDTFFNGYGSYRFYALCEKTFGEILAGTEYGLFILKNDSLIPFHHEIKSFTGWIDDICKTKDGKMLVTTRDNGLAVINNDEIDFINKVDGLQSNTCTSLFYDSLSGKIFLGLDKGLSVICFDEGRDYKSRPAKNNKPVIKNYNPTNGLLCGNIFSVTESNGEILLSTDKGLLIFHEGDLNTTVETPKVYIGNIQINGKNMDKKTVYNLYYKENNIRILFDGISFRNPKSLEYRYKLSPIDTGWNTTFSNTVIYSDLMPGNYQFIVQVRTGNGLWSMDKTSVSFTIAHPFWGTWWFYLMIVLILIIAVYNYTKWRERVLIGRRKRLENERSRISRDLHDDLGSGLVSIMMMSDQVHATESKDLIDSNILKIKQYSRLMVDQMDVIIWALNPANDTLENLLSYIKTFSEDYFENLPVKLNINIPSSITDIEMPGIQRRNILLVIKESFNNIVKYAQATEVSIEISLTKESLNFVITDNGTGFDMNETNRFGNGLKNMAKRMKDINGSFEISSIKGHGTQVFFSIPLKG